MPGIAQKSNTSIDDCTDTNTNYRNTLVGNGPLCYHSYNGSSDSSNGFWSKHRDDMSYSQLQKFWCELTPQARQKLLRIDKQTLFEHARKNMYCSRCNGLLLEGFLQIVLYGKSLQQDTADGQYIGGSINSQNDGDVSVANGCQGDLMDPSVHPWGGLTTARDGTLTLLDYYLCSKSLKGLQNVFDSARARERERKLLYPDACGGGGRGWISQGIVGYGRGHGARETCALHTARLSVETLVDFWSALGEETRQSLQRMKEEDFIERLMYRFDSKRFCRDCRRNVIREFKELKELKRMRREPCCTSWFCVADTAFQYEVSCDTVHADWHQTFLDTFGTYHHFEWAIGSGEGKSDILEFENVGLIESVQVNGLDLRSLNACYITLRAWKMDGRCNELCVKAHALRGQQCVHCRLVVGDGYVTITRGESIRRFFEHAEEAEEEEDDDSMDKDGNELDGGCSRPQKHAKSPELAREFLLDAATVIFKEQVEKAFREGTARQNAHSIFVCLALKLLEERVHVACKEIITLEKQVKLLEEEEREKREEEERKERRRTKEREKKLRRKERLREKENKEKKCAELAVVDPVVPEVTLEEGASLETSRDSVSETGEEATPASPLSSDIQDDHLLMEVNPNSEKHFEVSQNEEFHNTRDWNTSLPYNHYKYSRRKTKFRKDPQQDLAIKWCDRRKSASFSENGVTKYESRFHVDGFESTRSNNGRFNKQLRTKFVNRLDSPISDTPKTYYRAKCAQAIVDVRPKNKTFAGNPFNTKKVWEPLDSRKKFAQSNSASSDDAMKSTLKPETCESDDVIDISVQNSKEEKDVTDLKELSGENHRRVDSSICSSSNSDNCSCLSEGDSNTSSSNPQNLESASTSDSEVSSHNSEGKETSHCFEKNGQASNRNLEPKEAAKSFEEVRDHVKIRAPPPQSDKLPQMQNQSLHYPVFQGPTMGYYHQSPVSWHSGPSNGLMSFPHSNHYLYATNSFGYELNGNAQFMQYGAVKHLPPPLLNPAHAPTFPPFNQVRTNEVVNMQKAASVGQSSGETRKVANGGPNGKSDKTDNWSNSFSLFHFGVPVALSTGLKEGSVGDSVNSSDNTSTIGNDQLCNKKDLIEEYNLFAASNGIKFSIF